MPAIDTKMTPEPQQQIINELQDVIIQTIDLIDRFEEREMEEQLVDDYEQLHMVLEKALKKQPKHIQALIT